MTVSSQTSRVSYAGNGSTTAFAVSFYFLADSHLKVILRAADGSETVKTLTTDYTVSGAGNPSGGTVTMLAAPASGTTLVIVRNVPNTQETDYQANDDFPAESHERALDKLTMIAQQQTGEIAGVVKFPVSDPTNLNATLPNSITRANKLVRFDASGNIDVTTEDYDADLATVAAIADDVTTVAGISTDVTAVADNETNVTTVAGSIANVNLVGADITNVNAVAADLTNIDTVATNIADVNTTATNIAAVIDAPNQADAAQASANAAAASAAAAAASAASGMYSAVQDKSADYTVVVGDAGDLIRMTTSGGARTVTLPAISTVPDGFNVTVVKWTGDTNNVTVTRSGSDTINGSTSYVLDAQYKSATFVADSATSTWFASGSGSSSTNIIVDAFNGTGSQTAFTLSGDPGTENNTQVFVGGVYQEKDTYSVSGSTLTFSAAPPAGTSNIEVVWSQPLSIGVPADASVGTVKLADSAVTTAKMADANVTTAKIADSNVTYAKLSSDVQGAMYGFKNRIINGAMMIDQRNAGASVTSDGSGYKYPVDRFAGYGDASDGVFTLQQSSAAPVGFTKSIKATVTTADSSLSTTNRYFIRQPIEGSNVADLGFGAIGASSVTLSFWVRSSITGQHSGSVMNDSFDRVYPYVFTINAADTWEYKTVTISGDTTGTWLKDTGAGMSVIWNLGAGASRVGTAGAWQTPSMGLFGATGSVNVISTSGATFYITGVQLEKGSTATSFDYRPYGTELALCQRYYQKFTGQSYSLMSDLGVAYGTTDALLPIQTLSTWRAVPSVNSSAANLNDSNSRVAITALSVRTAESTTNKVMVRASVASGLTAYRPYYISANNDTTAYLELTAEL